MKKLILFLILSLPYCLIAQETNCNDGLDNDGDGLIDCYDIDCNGLANCPNGFPCLPTTELYQIRNQSLVRFDPNSSAAFIPVIPSIGYPVNAIGYNVQDGYLYGLRTDNGLRNRLIRMDFDGNAVDLGAVNGMSPNGINGQNIHTGDFDLSGKLYVTRSDEDIIYVIDVNNFSSSPATTILLQKNTNCSDFAYNPIDNNFYGLSGNGTLHRFELSGTVTDLTPTGYSLNCSTYGAAFADKNGSLYFFCNNNGSNQIELIRIDNADTGSPISSFLKTVSGTLTNNDGAACALSGGVVINDPFDPCCPPLTKESMVDFFTPTFTGGANSSYQMIFSEDQTFKNMMQAYIDLLNLTCGATELHFAWQLCEKGTGNQPANNYCNNPIEKEYFHFVAGGNGVIQNTAYTSTGFFNNIGAECQPNTWYSIVVGMYPNNSLNCFDTQECSATTSFDFRWQIQKNMKGKPMIEIRGIGSKKIKRKKKSVKSNKIRKRN